MRLVAAALLTTLVPMLVGQRWVGGGHLVRWSLGAVLGMVFAGFGVMMAGLLGLPLLAGGAAILAVAWVLGPHLRWTPPVAQLGPTNRNLLLLVGGVGTVLLVLATMRPVASWDGWFMWSLKSKSLAVEGSFSTPVFLSEIFVHSSQDYPTLLPSWQASAYQIAGDLTVSWPLQWQGAWLWLVAGLALLALTAGVSRLATLLPFAWLVSPQVTWESMQGYADVPMALLLVLGTVVLWRAGDDPRAHVVAGILLGGAALTKAEGLPLVAIVLVCVLVGRGLGPRAWLAPAVALGLRLPWLAWTTFQGIGNHMITERSFSAEVLSLVPGRIPLIWSIMVPEALTPVRWALLVPACVAAIVVVRRVEPRLLVAVVLSLLLWTTVYALWPERSWALESYMTVNVDRLLISSLGLLALAASLLPAGARDSASVSAREPAPVTAPP